MMILFCNSLRAILNGRKDGMKEIPSNVNESGHFEEEMINVCNAEIVNQKLKTMKKTRYIKEKIFTSNSHIKYYKEEISRMENDYDNLNSEINKLKGEYEEIRNKLTTIDRIWFIWLVIAATVDIPINGMVFNVFQDSIVLTWVLAVSLGFVYIGLAHILGKQLQSIIQLDSKYTNINSKFYKVSNIIVLIITAICILFSFYCIAVIRANDVLSLPNNVIIIRNTFLSFSIIIFILSTWITYYYSSKEKEENILKYNSIKMDIRTKKMEKGKVEREINKNQKLYNKEESSLSKQFGNSEALWSTYKCNSEKYKQRAFIILNIYRKYNVRYRQNLAAYNMQKYRELLREFEKYIYDFNNNEFENFNKELNNIIYNTHEIIKKSIPI